SRRSSDLATARGLSRISTPNLSRSSLVNLPTRSRLRSKSSDAPGKPTTIRPPAMWFGFVGSFSRAANAVTCDVSSPIRPIVNDLPMVALLLGEEQLTHSAHKRQIPDFVGTAAGRRRSDRLGRLDDVA